MSVKKLKPVSNAQRFRVVNDFDMVTVSSPEKTLVSPKKRSGGRNNKGRMTVRHIGGGHKRQYRIIDFKEINMIPQEKLFQLNTIQIVHHSLL